MLLELLLLVARGICIVFFITQSIRYSRLAKDQRDNFTVLTFSLLALSLLSLFITRAFTVAEQHLSGFDSVDRWFDRNREVIRIIQGLLRPTLAYLFQNLAMLINLERWYTILRRSD